MSSEDPACITKLAKPSKQVLNEGLFIRHEPPEKRILLWNRIKINREMFVDGECGNILDDLDIHFRGIFDASLLCLSSTFKDEGSEALTDIFSGAEYRAYEHFERMRIIEIYSSEDLKKKIIKKDNDVMEILRNYYLFGDSRFDEILDSAEIRPSLRYFFHKRWDEIKKKINEAASVLIMDSDYLVKLIRIWEDEGRRIASVSGENERKKIFDDLRCREDKLSGELTGKDEEISRCREEIEGLKERLNWAVPDKNQREEYAENPGRYVTSGEARQYEINLLNRFGLKFSDFVSSVEKKYRVCGIREDKVNPPEYFKERFDLSSDDYLNIPRNSSLKIDLIEKKIFGRKEKVRIYVAFISRQAEYARYSCDCLPAGLKDLNIIMDNVRSDCTGNKIHAFLFAASPTGFDDKCRSVISGNESAPNNSCGSISVCLYDPETGCISYNSGDPFSRTFSKLCNPELPEEKKLRLKDEVDRKISEEIAAFGWCSLESSFDKKRDDILLIKQLFYRFAEEKGYCVKYVKDSGLVMM
ncbi:hypothetical protein [Methanoplanus endosymbiosus]|uniref:Uncharacterized protein n=1 Tax=Methanoplanus endosymbiosus TaxID=33865 RepID=A0A9E7PPY9_9EURY|nr:hypothetical protein [Methanoplanus endosymbiosus]UUX92876.1 hypothetical protein L6E24_01740 [Methanoplanus endosymbiosus]